MSALLKRVLVRFAACGGRQAEPTSQPEPNWGTAYICDEKLKQSQRTWRDPLQPSVLSAGLAIAGRALVGPLALIVLSFFTKYLSSDATVLIKSDSSIFAFTEHDVSMAGGCTGCLGPCKIALLKFMAFDGQALTSAPAFAAFAGQPPTESLYNFSSLSDADFRLAESLDADVDTICHSGINEWGSTTVMVTSSPQQVLQVITTLAVSVSFQTKRELELAVENIQECAGSWTLFGTARLFLFRAGGGHVDFGKIPAVTASVFPEFTECRPNVVDDGSLVGSKLALVTDGEDMLASAPEVLTLFPYSFTSSLRRISRLVKASNTKYEAKQVLEPLLQGYYGGCRVREVNTSGVYIEETCETSSRWATYGLMVQSPDDIPLCSTGDACIHNYFNTQWEGDIEIAPANPKRVALYLNTFRNRYADKVTISTLPGIVVGQLIAMGMLSLYQTMRHKRSVLMTQIWAYRCQNGKMQVVYLAQILYHLTYNSDLYLIGFATGTLTTESMANLTCCFFAFSYSLVSMAKARTDQRLDRHFRLTWEAMQMVVTMAVMISLRLIQRIPLEFILVYNAEILRKTSTLGAKYCGLHDACVLFTVGMSIIIAVASVVLGFVAVILSVVVKKLSPKTISTVPFVRLGGSITPDDVNKLQASDSNRRIIPKQVDGDEDEILNHTSFEMSCLGKPFTQMFLDCDDFAYITYNGKKCTTVEAVLLSGYLFYGEYIYEAPSLMLLVVARFLSRKLIRSFNFLLLRWHVDSKTGKLTQGQSSLELLLDPYEEDPYEDEVKDDELVEDVVDTYDLLPFEFMS